MRTRRPQEPPITDAHGAPRLAVWSVRRPWRALGAWLLVIALAVAASAAVGTKMVSESDSGVGDSGKAERIAGAVDFASSPATEQVLVRARAGSQLAVDEVETVRSDLARELAKTKVTRAPHAPIASASGRAALIQWTIRGKADDAVDKVPALHAAVSRVQRAHPDLRVDSIGGPSIAKALDDALGSDFKQAETLSLPITLAILILVFGALVAASIPLLLAITAIAGAFGVAGLTSHLIPQTNNLQTILLLVGVAVGVDYALFMLRRSRDERRAGAGVRDSVLIASATSGRAVLISGLTVMVAMAGMLLTGDATFSSLGVASVIVVAVAVLGSLLALPALLVVLGDKVDRLRVPFLHRFRSDGESRIWGAIVPRVLRRPGLALALSGGALVLLALPALGMNTRLTDETDLPRSIPIVQTYDALTAAFPSEGSGHTVVVKATDVTAPPVRAQIRAFGVQVERSNLFSLRRAPEVEISDDHTVARITVPFAGSSESSKASAGVTELRQSIVPLTVGRVAEAYVSGPTAGSRDFNGLVGNRLPLVMAFVVVLTFLLMLASFRSVSVALATIALNGLSVAAAYGLLVVVFQHHWFDGLLGATTNGAIVAWLPLFLFVILFGLSMDYHVFVLSRIREAVLEGASPNEAISEGVRSSAGVVTSAAVVMMAAFAIFATLATIDFKQLGVGLAAAIAIDATIVRGVLLPSALALLGDRAWQESRIARALPAIGHGEAALRSEPAA